jgi:hypothetical protein
MDTQSLLKKAADKCGVVRLRYKERDVPTSVDGIVVFPFFGDLRSSFVLSSMLLKRIREEQKGSRYFVMLSWPGFESLYPYVDEYWQVEDESSLSKLRSGQNGFDNISSLYVLIQKALNQHFYDVMSPDDLSLFYSSGITKNFFERFKHIKVTLPAIPSASSLGSDTHREISRHDSSVFIRPCREGFSWRNGHLKSFTIPVQFWMDAISKLSSSGFFPVVFSDHFCYDLSSEVKKGGVNLTGLDLSKMMSAMRLSGCVLDFFGDTSRIALCARTPFLCFEERLKYNSLKEYEINDLCGLGVQKNYIFSFSTILESGDRTAWDSNILNHAVVKLKKIHETMDRDKWPSAAEYEDIVPYNSVRKIKNKKLGSRFIRIEKP